MKRTVAAALAALMLTGVAAAQSRRPTPHEAIERNLAPLTAAARELHLTDDERARTADVLERGEATAAEMVEAERHGDHAAIRARARRVELLARLLRARVEALRAEATAAERERATLTADERRTQARATLERASERRVALDRTDGVSSFSLPPPDADAGARPSQEAPR